MYESPRVEVIGTLADLTEYNNKIGQKPDAYSGIVPVVGSIVSK